MNRFKNWKEVWKSVDKSLFEGGYIECHVHHPKHMFSDDEEDREFMIYHRANVVSIDTKKNGYKFSNWRTYDRGSLQWIDDQGYGNNILDSSPSITGITLINQNGLLILNFSVALNFFVLMYDKNTVENKLPVKIDGVSDMIGIINRHPREKKQIIKSINKIPFKKL